MWYLGILDRGLVPDWVIRRAIRQRCRRRLEQAEKQSLKDFVEELKSCPVAVHTADANEQHYEVPPEFFRLVLGPHLKYSCGYWPEGTETLEASESRMLELTCERAGLADGQDILELGCGWGSLTLFMARKYPRARITAVSNSAAQRQFITARAQEHGLKNLEVITADMNTFQPEGAFDRVVSVEMFEHMKNYGELLRRISRWLKPQGALFVHMFVHESLAYHYEAEGPDDWMARYFFTGGTMPSHSLLEQFPDDLQVAQKWAVNGRHYHRTCEAWLWQMDSQPEAIRDILSRTYGPDQVTRWWVRWRIFFMACAELFAFGEGQEWFVGHYLLEAADSVG